MSVDKTDKNKTNGSQDELKDLGSEIKSLSEYPTREINGCCVTIIGSATYLIRANCF